MDSFRLLADEVLQLTLVGEPTAPVATLGVAVAFYLGFKNTSAFGRWWEARNIWGKIVNGSRDWANAVTHLVDPPAAPGDDALRRTLIERHIAWLNLLAFQLRTQTPLSRKRRRWMFGHPPRRGDAALHQTSDSWQAYLPPEARAELDGTANKAAHLIFRQGETLREMAEAGRLDPIRHVALMDRLQALVTAQGK